MEINLTILVPLKDRSKYTTEWIKYNIYDDFNYIFADGSVDDANKRVIDQIIFRENVEYLRFEPDISYNHYYKKMYESARLAKTKFIMTVDNDDFINPGNLRKIIYLSKKNNSFDIFQGVQSQILKKKNYFRLTQFTNFLNFYEGKTKSNIVNNLYFNNYRNLWYAVIRTEKYIDVWKACYDLKLKNIQSQELFLSLYLFLNTNFKYLPILTYIKTANVTDNNANKYKKSLLNPLNFRTDIILMKNFFKNHKNFDPKSFEKNFIGRFNKRKTSVHPIRKFFLNAIKKIFYPYLPFKFFLLHANVILFFVSKFYPNR